MTAERFFVETITPASGRVCINDGQVHHLRNVLRASVGERIEIFDGKGKSFACIIEKISPHTVTARIASAIGRKPTKGYRLNIACAIPQRQKMDLIIQKLTELEVDEIIPMVSERSVCRPDSQARDKLLKRWRRVSIEACRQCGRNTLPEIKPISTFDKLLTSLDKQALNLLPCLGPATIPVKVILRKNKSVRPINAFIGPEGDFSPHEVALAQRGGCQLISLGASVLKVETAAIFLAGIVKYEKQA